MCISQHDAIERKPFTQTKKISDKTKENVNLDFVVYNVHTQKLLPLPPALDSFEYCLNLSLILDKKT